MRTHFAQPPNMAIYGHKNNLFSNTSSTKLTGTLCGQDNQKTRKYSGKGEMVEMQPMDNPHLRGKYDPGYGGLVGSNMTEDKRTRNVFYGNHHPCVLYRPVKADDIEAKFNSV